MTPPSSLRTRRAPERHPAQASVGSRRLFTAPGVFARTTSPRRRPDAAQSARVCVKHHGGRWSISTKSNSLRKRSMSDCIIRRKNRLAKPVLASHSATPKTGKCSLFVASECERRRPDIFVQWGAPGYQPRPQVLERHQFVYPRDAAGAH